MLFRIALVVCLLIPGVLNAAPVIIVFGDSLSAAYGIPRESGWVTLLGKRLATEKPNYQLINASISGETSAGGLSRIAATLSEHHPAIVILELGANDGLRGLPLAAMANNLNGIVTACRREGAKVLLIGMRLPPNYGQVYTQKFQGTFVDLAKRHKLAFVPFLLAGVEDGQFFQADNFHPNTLAQPRIMENVWKALRPLLKP